MDFWSLSSVVIGAMARLPIPVVERSCERCGMIGVVQFLRCVFADESGGRRSLSSSCSHTYGAATFARH